MKLIPKEKMSAIKIKGFKCVKNVATIETDNGVVLVGRFVSDGLEIKEIKSGLEKIKNIIKEQ